MRSDSYGKQLRAERDALLNSYGSERNLAILVMDHRRKFAGSSVLADWARLHGVLTQPEDVFPDLDGFDVDAFYGRKQP